MLTFKFIPYKLIFKEPSGTSRGILKEKLTYFLRVADSENPMKCGFGEVPFFHGLSSESQSETEKMLHNLCGSNELFAIHEISSISSILMGVETALADLHYGSHDIIYPSSFMEGNSSLLINGLIWMGNFRTMKHRIEQKLKEGFKCIKIKIGAIEWQDEIELLKYIRNNYSSDLIIRLDANGAFSPKDCLNRLELLSKFNIHSIEQPIPPGNLSALHKICSNSPIPIALDEELIGHPIGKERSEFLEFVRPQFLILKPALCYGFSGTFDWIERATKHNIGWWITSALESAVGLNAIAQFTANIAPYKTHGLGTGNLFTNNLPSPIQLQGEKLFFTGPSYHSSLEALFLKSGLI